MPRKASKIKVGLFVLMGLALALGSIVYLGASHYLKGANIYVTYFDESVQGLQRDSVVKYLGVSVGRVEAIRVAPDYNLIEVVMDIRFTGDLPQTMVAQLKTVGITGIAFIELARRQPGEPDLSPRIDFASEYPIIPSKPSEVSRILSVVDRVAKQIGSINFAAMAARLDALLQAGETLLKDPQIKMTIAKVTEASIRLERLVAQAEQTLAAAKVSELADQAGSVLSDLKKTLGEGRRALSDARSLVPVVKDQIKGMDLPGASRQAKDFMEGLSGQTAEFLAHLNLVSENLRQASQVLERLLQKMEQTPSQIIFSQPPPPRQTGP